MLNINNRNNSTRSEICSKLTLKTPEPHHWRRSGVFFVNFEHISHLVSVFLEQVNVGYGREEFSQRLIYF